ncbi:hypothetical protein NGRA_3522, partial [Nosema granulosis]
MRNNQDNYENEKEGKALSLIITTNAFQKHIRNRINMSKLHLRILFRFRNLSIRNKSKLYHALVNSVLEYPPVPLHVASKAQTQQMQIVQNKAARIITYIRLREGQTNQTVN